MLNSVSMVSAIYFNFLNLALHNKKIPQHQELCRIITSYQSKVNSSFICINFLIYMNINFLYFWIETNIILYGDTQFISPCGYVSLDNNDTRMGMYVVICRLTSAHGHIVFSL